MNIYEMNAERFYEHFTEDAEIVLIVFQRFAERVWTEAEFEYVKTNRVYMLDRKKEHDSDGGFSLGKYIILLFNDYNYGQ